MRLLEKNEYPWLRKTVTDICKKNKVPVPQLALARTGAPNAFVFGRTPSSATLTVTQGLLNTLTKEEVSAVIGHEIGHIKNKDMVVMTIVAAIPVIAYYIARFLVFQPKNKEDRKGGALLVGLLAFIVYFVSNLLVLYLSRLREFYADNFSGRTTKPKFLSSALAKITYGLSISPDKTDQAARSFYIADPITSVHELAQFKDEYSDLNLNNKELEKAIEWEKRNPLVKISEIFSSHPLTWKRIKALSELEKELSKSS